MPYMPVAEWQPDLPAFENGGTPNVVNVIPHAKSYKPLPSLGTYSSGALTARAQGAIAALDKDGTVHVYAGDVTKLYELSAGDTTWTDRSRTVGGVYATASDGFWRFAQFGNKIIATNFVDDPQIITMGGANFAALTVSPPRSRYITVVRQQVMVGNTFDTTDGNRPGRVRWTGLQASGAGDETSWGVSAVTLADFNDLEGDGGFVQGLTGGEYGTIIQEKAVWRATFVGSPLVYQLDRIEGARGSPAPGSILKYEDFTFYLGQDGFYAFNGAHSVPIGANKIDKTFFADLDPTYYFRTSGASDPQNKLVFWAYPGAGNSGGTPNKLVIYDTVNNRWSQADGVSCHMLFDGLTVGSTLDNMDAVFGTNMDTHAFSLDSRVWSGGKHQIAGFTTAHKLGFLDGSNLAATIDTEERQIFEGYRGFVTGARPVVDGGTVTVAMVSRDLPTGSLTVGSDVSVNANGLCVQRSNARYHRARIKVAAGGSWTHASGVEVEARPEGRR